MNSGNSGTNYALLNVGCKRPFCDKPSTLGSDYCSGHAPETQPDGADVGDLVDASKSDIRRLERKLDRIIDLLEGD